MSQTQKAAVIADEEPIKGSLTKIDTIPIYQPSESQILIKTQAFALNPTDWKHIVFKQGKPGYITGSDASGVVVKVGSKVTGFKEGDVVSTFLHGNFFKERGAFAEYVIGDPETTIKYKKEFSETALSPGKSKAGTINTFEGAASVTLSVVTNVLSFAGNLNISRESTGYILIWGGATSTGILGIQIINHSYRNLKVITTASKKHAEFLKSIGADHVVDYHDSDAIDQIKKIAQGQIRYAWDTVSNKSTFQGVYDATADSPFVEADTTLFLGVKDVTADPSRKGDFKVVNPTLAYVANGDELDLFGGHFKADEDTLKRYNDFWFNEVPKFVSELVHPDLLVLESGFESVNKGLDLLQDDKVSGEKVVFRL